MKRIVLLAGILAGMLSSCVDNLNKQEPPVEPEAGKVSELVVPAGFDWKTSRNVRCDFTAEHASLVEVSVSESQAPFASVVAGPGVEPAVINIPDAVRDLYVSYFTKDGIKKTVKTSVTANTLNFSVPQDSQIYTAGDQGVKGVEVKSAQARSFPSTRAGNNAGLIYYPSSAAGWGTIMFEDLWPSYGDYDFNDFVVNYKVQLYLQNNNQAEAMMVAVRVKAVGGSIPNDLYLTLTGVRGGEIDYIEEASSYGSHNASAGAKMVQLNPGNNVHTPALFRFENIKQNAHKPAGAVYLNTEKGYEMSAENLVTVAYMIYFRNSVSLKALDFEKLDFFIATKKDKKYVDKEIHMKDFTPSLYGQTVYENCAAGNPNIVANKYYVSSTGLVWAIHVPADIPHAYEQTDFLKAYPKFKEWVSSGGEVNLDWYTQGNRLNENLVNYK